jgi:hypothetical protein
MLTWTNNVKFGIHTIRWLFQLKNIMVSTELKCEKLHIQKPFMWILSCEITQCLNIDDFINSKSDIGINQMHINILLYWSSHGIDFDHVDDDFF